MDRRSLPDVGPDPAFVFPPITRHRLSNGLDVRIVSLSGLPIVSVTLTVFGGSASDPVGRDGLAGMVADLIDEGTGDLDAIQVSEALADIGADYDVDVAADATVFSVTTLARFAERGSHLLARMTTQPTLAEADVARVRQLRLNRLRQLKDVPSAVAERALARVLYGTHPYGHVAMGDEASLAAVSRDDVVAGHRAIFHPARAVLTVAGGVPPEVLLGHAEGAFGRWGVGIEAAAVGAAAALPEPGRASRPRMVLVSRPGAAQSELRIARLAVPRDTPDYFPLIVMNAVLGGQFVSRLNLKLREEKGYTYGARSGFDWRKGVSPLVLHTSVHTASTAGAVADALAEFGALRQERPVTTAELELAKASLTRGYPQSFQTVAQLARAVSQVALYGLPDSYFSDFVPRVHAVTAEDVTRVAMTYLDPSVLTTLVIGDDSVVAAPLADLGVAPLEVLPA